MTSFRDLMPSYKGYAQFGYKRPTWEDNAMQKSPHTRGVLTAWTAASTLPTASGSEGINGGSNWGAITFQSKDGTTSTSDIPLNRLWNTLKGSMSFEEAVGFNHEVNPHGTQEWEHTKEHIRVKNCNLKIQVVDNGYSQVECLLIVWRSDAASIASAFDAVASTQTDYVSGTHDTPGSIGWTCTSTNTIGEPSSRRGYKSFNFSIPQYFNDIEWHNDSPNTGGNTNFWVPKGATNLFTGAPNMQLWARLYMRYPQLDNDQSRTVNVEIIQKWDVELHTGDTILVSPSGADA